MPIAAKTAGSQHGNSRFLRCAIRRLPEALVLIQSIKQSHKKPGTIFINYSLLLPYISVDTSEQENGIT